tara:strand:- start:52 stop:243 length:192 start_codon:yes stop_codon:yes gene_type:complete
MKLRPLDSTQPRIFEGSEYEHPWYQYLNKPNPPTKQAIEKAKFKDKTFHWNGGVRSGNKRTSK